MTSILALVTFDVLLVQTVLQRHDGCFCSAGLLLLGRSRSNIFQWQTQVQKALNLVRDPLAVLTRRSALEFSIKSLMNDAGAAVLAAYFGFLAVPVALVELFRKKLEKLVRVLLFCGDQILKRLLFAYPKPREDVGRRVAVSNLAGVKVLKHVIHCAAQTVWRLALMTVTKVKVAKDRVV